MGALRLSAIRLEAFKSFRAQTLPLEPLTLLVGRNGSGKSNALGGLTLLALLAEDRNVNDLERTRRWRARGAASRAPLPSPEGR